MIEALIIKFQLDGRNFQANTALPIELAIPLRFNAPQPNSYDLPPASAKAWEQEGLIGDTRRGGSCNFSEIRMVPHCNGTHTECVGHISLDRITIGASLKETLIPTTLITVEPMNAKACGDSYTPDFGDGDRVICSKALEEALSKADNHFLTGLIIRTLPNDDTKMIRRYMVEPPPFLTREAVLYLRKRMIRHLMLDIPSLDRTLDEGKLTAHHIFWNVPEGSHQVNPLLHSLNTITEFIYAPESVPDGKYLLNLQVALFESDAAPSRPVLFTIEELI